MISFHGQNLKEAWRGTVRGLYDTGQEIPEKNLYRFSPAMISVHDTRGEHYDDEYHLPVSEISEGNKYLITGEGEEYITDERIKAIRRRLFGVPEPEDEDQGESGEENKENENEDAGESESESEIERVISYLENLKNNLEAREKESEDDEGSEGESTENEEVGINLWQEEDPIQAIFFSLDDDGTLKTQVYRREVDGYRELLPDMSRFAALQHFVADRLGVPAGKYSYFSDALHFHHDDRDFVDLLFAR